MRLFLVEHPKTHTQTQTQRCRHTYGNTHKKEHPRTNVRPHEPLTAPPSTREKRGEMHAPNANGGIKALQKKNSSRFAAGSAFIIFPARSRLRTKLAQQNRRTADGRGDGRVDGRRVMARVRPWRAPAVKHVYILPVSSPSLSLRFSHNQSIS